HRAARVGFFGVVRTRGLQRTRVTARLHRGATRRGLHPLPRAARAGERSMKTIKDSDIDVAELTYLPVYRFGSEQNPWTCMADASRYAVIGDYVRTMDYGVTRVTNIGPGRSLSLLATARIEQVECTVRV